MQAIKRIHHISAIVGKSQENLDFYRDVLGLQLIKKTVNFDDPSVYHLYFADQNDDSDAVMTFFPWEKGFEGRKGSGQVGRIAFSVPKDSLDFWKSSLEKAGVAATKTDLFNRPTLEFQDPHSLDLALVESEQESENQHILGFYGAVLLSSNPEQTAKLLTQHLGLKKLNSDQDHLRFETVGAERHHIIVPTQILQRGRWGLGTVHHIAWSVPDDQTQLEWQKYLVDNNFGVTEVKDRNYFKAIYMKEKGDVIFEYATDGPGFAIDEDPDKLGEKLMLPDQFESRRQMIESHLPKLN